MRGDTPTQSVPNESATWADVYGQQTEIHYRRGTVMPKLRRLGVHRAPRDLAILDACCGHGETLNALHEMGFRNLSGIDLAPSPDLAADKRFAIRHGDVCRPDYPSESFDWILNIHALHHLGTPEQVERFLAECRRILKPGGRLSVVDFPGSVQIRLAFWWLRQNRFLWTPHLKNLSRILHEEWSFLGTYLAQWPRVRRLLYEGPLEIQAGRQRFFSFYLTLRKPSEPKG